MVLFLMLIFFSIFNSYCSLVERPNGAVVAINDFITVQRLNHEQDLLERYGLVVDCSFFDQIILKQFSNQLPGINRCKTKWREKDTSFFELVRVGEVDSNPSFFIYLKGSFQEEKLAKSFIEFCVVNPTLLTQGRIYANDEAINDFIPYGIRLFAKEFGDNKKARAFLSYLMRKEVPSLIGELIISYDPNMYLNRIKSINFIARQQYHSHIKRKLPLEIVNA